MLKSPSQPLVPKLLTKKLQELSLYEDMIERFFTDENHEMVDRVKQLIH